MTKNDSPKQKTLFPMSPEKKKPKKKKKRKIAETSQTEHNLFNHLPTALPEELIENLFQTENIRIERIVSTGQSSPENFWYDQPETEWVVLLRGEAALQFQGKRSIRRLKPGDYVLIPPHQKHRVFSTSETQATVWLAVFVKEIQPTQDKEISPCKLK